ARHPRHLCDRRCGADLHQEQGGPDRGLREAQSLFRASGRRRRVAACERRARALGGRDLASRRRKSAHRSLRRATEASVRHRSLRRATEASVTYRSFQRATEASMCHRSFQRATEASVRHRSLRRATEASMAYRSFQWATEAYDAPPKLRCGTEACDAASKLVERIRGGGKKKEGHQRHAP